MLLLSSLRVVDCSDLSGAFCGKLLGDLGAEVSVARDSPLIAGDAEGYFRAFYDGGKSVSQAGRERALSGADVVLTSGNHADLEQAGLDFARLALRRPRLIVANVSPFGLTGPRAAWRSSNLVAAACGGMMRSCGWPNSAPLQPLGLQAYHSAGLQMAIGVVLALLAREQTGRGQLVDISLQESVLVSVEHLTGAYREDGSLHERNGSLHWTRTFRTVAAADGDVVATHLGDWDVLSAWVEGDGQRSFDERWRDVEFRRQHWAELFDAISAWAARYRARELVEQAQLRRLAFAEVADLGCCARDPQHAARKFFVERRIDGESVRVPGPMFGLGEVLSSPAGALPDGGSRGVLEGLRVLDLTWVVAGPVATRVLADHGAEVIKVEHPATTVDGDRRGGLFGNLNRSKKSMAVDLAQPKGRELLRELVGVCDVMVDNFSPRVLGNWGLDDDELRRINPRLVTVHMSGFGRTGPRRDWVSYGPVLQAMTGCTFHMRHAGEPPAGWGYSYSDMLSGYAAALAVISAVTEGGARVVDFSQFEALTAVIGPALVAAANGAKMSSAIGNSSQEGPAAPHGVYRCSDGGEATRDRWCAIAVLNDSQWAALAKVVRARWTSEERFASCEGRVANSTALDELLEGWTKRRSVANVVEDLQRAGVPCGVVADAADMLQHDPQLEDRAAWWRLVLPDGRRVEFDAPAIRMEADSNATPFPGPKLGEQTDEILTQILNLTWDQVADLRRCGVVS